MAEGPICRQCGGPVLASQADASTQTDAPEFTRSRFIIGLQEELIRTQKLLQQALQHREQSLWMATGKEASTLTATPAHCLPLAPSPAPMLTPEPVLAAANVAISLAPSRNAEQPGPKQEAVDPHLPENRVVSQQPQPQLLAPLWWPLTGKHFLAEGDEKGQPSPVPVAISTAIISLGSDQVTRTAADCFSSAVSQGSPEPVAGIEVIPELTPGSDPDYTESSSSSSSSKSSSSSSGVEDNGKETDDPLEQELVITGDTVSTEKVGPAQARTTCTPRKCDVCGRTFRYLQGLRRHMVMHGGAKPHQCGQCGLQFARSGYLRTHERQVHQQQRPHHCPQCPKAFFGRTNLQIHMRSHTGERPYACKHCDKKFSQQGALKTHEQMVHELQRPHLCPECGKSFGSNRSLQTHQNTHTGERPFPCPECDRSFRSPQGLRIHVQSHSTDRPYSCEVCGRTFKTAVCLTGHRKTHTGERHFSCEVCGKAFARKESLKQHRRLHTGELPFPCMDCDRAFNRSSRLAEHRRLRHSQPSQRSAAEPGPSNPSVVLCVPSQRT